MKKQSNTHRRKNCPSVIKALGFCFLSFSNPAPFFYVIKKKEKKRTEEAGLDNCRLFLGAVPHFFSLIKKKKQDKTGILPLGEMYFHTGGENSSQCYHMGFGFPSPFFFFSKGMVAVV
eukprot:TRINITY_DN29705_c0_g1_i1.p1 TRINITY_DN29705_c0_g1~~TRINITY_DN29705_c0_g1_i1.p1  ORF type:complete len:118 (+),score=5.86 TRINITY_DN29705_c0_g1_i1:164-517(+)